MANRQYLYLKTTAPTINDDGVDGYKIGDIWLDTTNDKIYVVIDITTGAAIWQQYTGSGLTILAPTIADFTNAQHDHGDGDDGGALVAAALGLTTQGDVPYRDASGLARLPASTAGLALVTGGAGANPSFAEKGYPLKFYAQSFSPLDATTYFFGSAVVVASTTAAMKRVYVPRAGTIVRADITVHNNGGTQGSSENSTLSLRLNNTTDEVLTSSFNVDDASGNSSFFNVTGLSLAVAEGDYLEGKWLTPTFATNPTNVCIEILAYLR